MPSRQAVRPVANSPREEREPSPPNLCLSTFHPLPLPRHPIRTQREALAPTGQTSSFQSSCLRPLPAPASASPLITTRLLSNSSKTTLAFNNSLSQETANPISHHQQTNHHPKEGMYVPSIIFDTDNEFNTILDLKST